MSRFVKYMVHVDIGTDEKLADLTDAERLCHVVGVLAIAAKSPIRGCLIVGDEEATPTHVARRAAVSTRVAKKTMEKLTAVGVLVRDEEVGALRVHNWERFNPEPKADPSNAERQARWRARNGQKVTPVTQTVTDKSNGALTRAHAKRAGAPSPSPSPSTSPSVVEEPETNEPSSPREVVEEPQALVARAQPRVTYRGKAVGRGTVDAAVRLLDDFNRAACRSLAPWAADGTASSHLRQIVGALLDRPDVSVEQWAAGVYRQVADPPGWVDGPVRQVGQVFGEKAADWALDEERRSNGHDGLTEQGRMLRELRLSAEGATA